MQALPAGRGVAKQIPLFAMADSPRDVDVHGISRPARQFTGDFYFSQRTDDTLWLVIGDVAGKGLEAAVVMAMIQEHLEEQIASGAVSLDRLHLALRDILPRNRFATVAIAQIRDDGRLTVTNGGHCPLLIARRDGTIDTIGSTGAVVGLLPNATWRSVELQLRRGDTLLAYTDGVIESRNAAGEEFGMGRLRAALATARGSVREIASHIEAALDGYASQQEDDVTIIVARR